MCMLRARLYEENTDAHNVCLYPSKEYARLVFDNGCVRPRLFPDMAAVAVSRYGRKTGLFSLADEHLFGTTTFVWRKCSFQEDTSPAIHTAQKSSRVSRRSMILP
jgi:hypothetical protein